MIFGKRRERKYLESLGQYEMDKASAELVRVNNYGMRQDLLNQNLSFIQKAFGAKTFLDGQSEGYKASQNMLLMIIGISALVLILLVAFALKSSPNT